MTTISLPWDGDALGDCGPYSAEVFTHYVRNTWNTHASFPGGVFWGWNASVPAANTVRVTNGAGQIWGRVCETDDNTDFSVPTPSVSTRIDRIVLRSDYAAQEIRLAHLQNPSEGTGAPALTQNAGVLWEIALWQVSITTGGNITLTDERIKGLFEPTPVGSGATSNWSLSANLPTETWTDIADCSITKYVPWDGIILVWLSCTFDGPVSGSGGRVAFRVDLNGAVEETHSAILDTVGYNHFTAHWAMQITYGSRTIKGQIWRATVPDPDSANMVDRRLTVLFVPVRSALDGVL